MVLCCFTDTDILDTLLRSNFQQALQRIASFSDRALKCFFVLFFRLTDVLFLAKDEKFFFLLKTLW